MIYSQIDSRIKNKKIEDLIDLPMTILVNKFDEASAKEFREQFAKAVNTGQKIIPIMIDSWGGGVHSLLSMLGSIRNSPVPVATIATGKACSCGLFLLMMGSEVHRYMDAHAVGLLHEVSAGTWGKLEDMKADVKETERLNNYLFEVCSSNVGKSRDYFMKLVADNKNADVYLTAEECKKHNIVNHVRIPAFRAKIDVSVSFE